MELAEVAETTSTPDLSALEDVVYCKTYTYDLAGNRTGFTLEKGDEVVHNIVYTYDNLNRLSTVKKNGTVEATYTYDTNGNRASLTYANGVVTTYSYNLANWITNLSNKNSDGETLSSYSYTYYTSGNQASKTDNTGKVTSYIYDDLGRLKQESESTGLVVKYTYNSSGNRIQMRVTGTENYNVSYIYNAANQLISEGKTVDEVLTITEYTYDANGNTLTITSPESLQVNTYNLFNQLVSTNINGNCSAYAYNTNGIRTAKSVNGVCTTFLLDGGNVVGEVQSGEVTATYLRGANLISRETDTSEQYYIFNAHGDVTGLVNNSQTVEKTYDYDAFGNEKEPSATDTNPFRYCGEYFDKETGTYYLRARYYDPSIGRFTQQDTHWNTANMIYGDNPNKINEREDALGLKTYTYAPSINSIMQSGNLYVYGLNNPLFYQDYSGNFVITTAALCALGKVALTKVVIPFVIGLASQAATDVIEYAYNPEGFEPSSAGQYIWSGLTNTFTFGISNPITKSAFSAFGSELIDAWDKAMAKKPPNSTEQVLANIGLNVLGDCAIDKISSSNSILNEVFPESQNNGSKKNNSVSFLENNTTKDNISDILNILPNAYKSVVINHKDKIFYTRY